MSRRQRGYPWPSLAISPYHSSPPAGLQSYILYIVAVCRFVLVVPLLHIHMWGSTGVSTHQNLAMYSIVPLLFSMKINLALNSTRRLVPIKQRNQINIFELRMQKFRLLRLRKKRWNSIENDTAYEWSVFCQESYEWRKQMTELWNACQSSSMCQSENKINK